jgi:very-short-patch-repair endonuclease
MTTNEVEYYKGLLDQLGPLKQILQATNPVTDADNYHALFKRMVTLEMERLVLPWPTVQEEPFNLQETLAARRLPDVRLDSEIERLYWNAYGRLRPPDLEGLVTQHDVLGGKYRIDFALPDEKIGIEVDGYAYHSDPFTFTQDRQRQREIEEDGWRFIRFSGKEVRADPQLCLIQTARLVRVFRGESPTCW